MSRKCFQVSNSCLIDLRCPLLRGSSDCRLRKRAATLPPLWKAHSQAQSSFHFSGPWRWRCRARRKKLYPSGLVTWVESIVASRHVRRLPAVEGAYVHWRRRSWGWFWRLRWLRTIIVIVCISPCRCSASLKVGSKEWSLRWSDVNKSQKWSL